MMYLWRKKKEWKQRRESGYTVHHTFLVAPLGLICICLLSENMNEWQKAPSDENKWTFRHNNHVVRVRNRSRYDLTCLVLSAPRPDL